jgi:UTP:GlnB (protein PII) uridylyltransferase
MGVGEDFATFKDNYTISAALISSIAARYQRITRQLNSDFWSTTSETAHSLYVGSYGRETAATGISDLDIVFVLPDGLYEQYNAHLYNGQSALLQAVKRSIQKTYSTSESFGDGQSLSSISRTILPSRFCPSSRARTVASSTPMETMVEAGRPATLVLR